VATLGYGVIGQLNLVDDPDGAVLHFLGNGSDIAVEVFTYETPLLPPIARPGRGFAGPLADPVTASQLETPA
jgi:hypothetical protein